MTSWVVSIDRHHPNHWRIAKSSGFWDLSKERDIQRGDLVYFWQAGKSFLAKARATTDAIPLAAGMPASWEDSGSRQYEARFEFEVLNETPVAQPRWIKEVGPRLVGKTPDLRTIPRFDDPRDEALLASYFDAASSPDVEQKPEQTLDDAHRERILESLDEDLRVRRYQFVALRQGQPRFRNDLLRAYDGRCAITGTTVESVLEAAHIYPHKGEHTNEVWNGLLLRADLHTLFDLFLITVAADSLQVRVAPGLVGSDYASLDGRKLVLPMASGDHPERKALERHNSECTWLHA